MKIGLNINVNKAKGCHHESWLPTTLSEAHASPETHSMKNSDKSIRSMKTLLPIDNWKMIAQQHADEKLAIELSIVGTWLIAHQFW